MRCPQCNVAMYIKFEKWRCPQGHAALPASPEDIEEQKPHTERKPMSEIPRLAEREEIPQDAIEAWEHAGSIGIQVEINPTTALFSIADGMNFSNQRNSVPAIELKQALEEVITNSDQDWGRKSQ